MEAGTFAFRLDDEPCERWLAFDDCRLVEEDDSGRLTDWLSVDADVDVDVDVSTFRSDILDICVSWN
jgi:hypothetical protein